MTTNSPNNTILLDQLRECYGRVVWTHKTHEKCKDILDTRNHRIKLAQIILSAITTTGIIATMFADQVWAGYAAVGVSFILTILNAYVKRSDLGKLSQQHSAAATALWNQREHYLTLLTDFNSGTITDTEARERRDKLQASLHKVYMGTPSTNVGKAYLKATKALKENEEMTFSDDEIDKLLPLSQRKSKS